MSSTCAESAKALYGRNVCIARMSTPATGNVILVTAPKSLRELFDQIGLEEVPATDGTVVMEMPVDERVMS